MTAEARLVLEDLWIRGPDGHHLVAGISLTARALKSRPPYSRGMISPMKRLDLR